MSVDLHLDFGGIVRMKKQRDNGKMMTRGYISSQVKKYQQVIEENNKYI